MDKNYTIKKISEELVEITINIPKDAFTKSYETLLKRELDKTEIKGFRKGQAPKEAVEARVKPLILYETFEKLAPYYVNKAVLDEKLEIAATPEYKDMPQLETNKDLSFTVSVTIMPDFKLANLGKIKVEVKKEKVTEKEIEEIMKKLEENKQIKAKKGTKAWAVEVAAFLHIEEVKDIETLKAKIGEILQIEKDRIVEKNAEAQALSKAIEMCKIKVPDKAVHFEAHEREHSLMHNLESIKMSVEKYAAAQGTTVEAMRELWHKDAKEALETDVFLKLFAKEKKIEVTDEQLESEIEKIKKSQKGNEELYSNIQWREYIRVVIKKQKAYEQFILAVMPKSK